MSGYKYDDEDKSFGWLDRAGNKTPQARRLLRRSPWKVAVRIVVIAAGWALVAYLMRVIAVAASNSVHKLYDPFEILGIATSATEKEVRRQYRKLSLKFHPDKHRSVANETKEEIDSHYIELTKAYKSRLTDDTVRKNLELYGHPDGKQELSIGIALPTWIVDAQNNTIVLAFYGLVFGVILPLLVARWWYGSRSRTKDGVLNATALNFFTKLAPDATSADIPLLVAQTSEVGGTLVSRLGTGDDSAYAELERAVLQKAHAAQGDVDVVPADAPPNVRRGVILLYAYLYRVPSSNARVESTKFAIGHYTEKLLTSLLAMSSAHSRLTQTNMLRAMIPRVVQALPLHSRAVDELLQLPHMTDALATEAAQSGTVGARGMQAFWKVPDAERRQMLIGPGKMTPAQYDECMRTLGEWPRIELVDAYFTVVGEETVTTGAIMQLVIKIRLLPLKRDGSLLANGHRLDAKDKSAFSSVRAGTGAELEASTDGNLGKQPSGVAHAPFFAEERKPQWFIQMGDQKNDNVIVAPVKHADVGPNQTRVIRINVQAPPEPGVYTFMVEVSSDSYLGSSAVQLMKLHVEEAPEPNAGEDDDISDPEEDTLAGQMALMRGERVKPSAVYADNDDDDDEDDDNDEDDDDDSDDSDED
ncbi:secretory subunit [Malassezia sp. CBS 17886]|nr:secretory subunit [Malassezia sp. CBS 17886]